MVVGGCRWFQVVPCFSNYAAITHFCKLCSSSKQELLFFTTYVKQVYFAKYQTTAKPQTTSDQCYETE